MQRTEDIVNDLYKLMKLTPVHEITEKELEYNRAVKDCISRIRTLDKRKCGVDVEEKDGKLRCSNCGERVSKRKNYPQVFCGQCGERLRYKTGK